eukprot:999487-Rhodomonas_salina.1
MAPSVLAGYASLAVGTELQGRLGGGSEEGGGGSWLSMSSALCIAPPGTGAEKQIQVELDGLKSPACPGHTHSLPCATTLLHIA